MEKVYRFTPEDINEALNKPCMFFEELKDDDAQLVRIGDLVPTPNDPGLKMYRYHGDMISVEGIAIGEMVRTEDIPQLKNSPIHFTLKAIGVIDLTGAIPVIGISSEDASGEVFGHFRFELSVYSFDRDKTYAFLINKQAVPLDPIAHVERAQFGNRVKSSLSGYMVSEIERVEVTSDLILEQVDLLLPQDINNPLIMTRHPGLATWDFLKTVAFDGYLIDGKFLGIPGDILAKYGAKVIVVNQTSINYEKAALPVAVPSPVLTPTPGVAPVPPPMSVPLSVSHKNTAIKIVNIDKVAEMVVIKNESTVPVNLTGWYLISKTGNQRFSFPKCFTLNNS